MAPIRLVGLVVEHCQSCQGFLDVFAGGFLGTHQTGQHRVRFFVLGRVGSGSLPHNLGFAFNIQQIIGDLKC